MSEYYVFANQTDADACIAFINNTPWFPLVGNKNGVLNPNAQKTTCWCTESKEMVSGEYAVPRIPNSRLDLIGVPQGDRDGFMSVFGQDIRELTMDDFVQPPIEELL